MPDSLPTVLGGMLAGASGGLLSGLFGVGGGLAMVPLLSLLLGMDQHRAQGATLAIMMMPVGIPGLLQYRKKGIEWDPRVVGLVAAGFVCGVSLGSLAASAVPQAPLRLGFVCLLLCAAAYAWLRGEAGGAGGPAGAAGPIGTIGTIGTIGAIGTIGTIALPGLLIGAAGGAASGLSGLGGAVVMIPLLVRRFRMTQHQAQMTSLLVLLPPMGLPGVLVYARAAGGLPWPAILGAVAGFDLGSYFGARLAAGMSGTRLRRLHALLLLCMAAAMAWGLSR
jgi:uncharacterized membrane protein YfcA